MRVRAVGRAALFFTALFLWQRPKKRADGRRFLATETQGRNSSGNGLPERKTVLTMLAEAFYNNGAVAKKIQKLTKKSENCGDSIGSKNSRHASEEGTYTTCSGPSRDTRVNYWRIEQYGRKEEHSYLCGSSAAGG